MLLFFGKEFEAHKNTLSHLKKIPDFWSFRVGAEEIATQKEIELVEKENYLMSDSCFYWLLELIQSERLLNKYYGFLREEAIKTIIFSLNKARNLRWELDKKNKKKGKGK